MVTVNKDEFRISEGNLQLLSTIPLMMQFQEWRAELRRLYLEFLTSEELNEKTD